ncbi:hypothetical protein WI91_02395 [Burkholderia vietnamiensis]|uniref:hypothetical protein n=1 Tax=Burkholderia vietnamiensis TaxID=60552 RepID=UPI00076DD1C2|nr:hypothetical protein [Burkholderia vietnamiensis]KVD99664.1 hypothetical protein WI91_02395 [Burkholderia vietnamiensis]
MKQPKGVDDLAARLGAAAASPLVPVAVAPVAAAPAAAAPPEAAPVRQRTRTAAKQAKPAEKGAEKKEPADTMQLTIRPTRTLYARYVSAAADRSRQLGRMVSAQEVMLEILEKGEV